MAASPVLLVHGFASSFERNWREPGWVDLLAEAGRAVIPVDLPGHGDAPKPHDAEAYGNLEESVLAAARSGGGNGPVDAVGFSLGARLLLGAACREPERFGRLVIAGVGDGVFTDADAGRSEALARAVETGAASDGDPPAAASFARFGQAAGNDPLALAACLRRPAQPLEPAALARLRFPVLVVLGDRDFAGPGQALVDALPDARFVGIRGLDHFGTPKDFRFVDAALGFLNG